jgi:hypothetical protein
MDILGVPRQTAVAIAIVSIANAWVSYARHRRELKSIQRVASAEISPVANNPGWLRTFITVKTMLSTAMLCSESNFAPSVPDSCQAILLTNPLLGKDRSNGKTAYSTQLRICIEVPAKKADQSIDVQDQHRPHQVANSIVMIAGSRNA